MFYSWDSENPLAVAAPIEILKYYQPFFGLKQNRLSAKAIVGHRLLVMNIDSQ